MITIIKLRDLFANLSKKGMAQVFADWEMLVGFQAKAVAGGIRVADSVEEVAGELSMRHVVVETTVQKGTDPLGPIYFAFPNGLVVSIIADLLMIPESARETKAKEGLSENDLEGFREMANLLCGAWNRTFQDLERDLRISQSVDDLVVSPGDGDTPTLEERCGEGRVAYVSLEVECDGQTFPAILALPFDVAVRVGEQFYSEAA